MISRVAELSNLAKLPLGRCGFALRAVAERADAVGQREIASFAQQGADSVKESMAMALRFQASPNGQYPPEAVALDGQVDNCVAGVAGYLDVQRRVYPDEPAGLAAERLSRALLPEGIAAVTRLPFTEQHEQIDALLQRAEADDLAGDIGAVPELRNLLARLRKRNQEYGEVLRQSQSGPSRDEVREALEESQERVAQTLSLIIGLYASRDPEKVDERDHLLEPILVQDQATRALRRRRRAVVDVDPDTGETLDPSSNAGDNGAPEPTGPQATEPSTTA